MKRSIQCAFGATALLCCSSAWAQSFGQKGQIAISAERLFGYAHNSTTTTANSIDTTNKTDSFSLLSSPLVGTVLAGQGLAYNVPRVAGDYFIIDSLSVGLALGYAHDSFTTPGNANAPPHAGSFTFAPRVGYAYLFSDTIGVWPRAGFTYRTFSYGIESAHVLALSIDAPFVFCLVPHVVFTAGPTLDLGLSGSDTLDPGGGRSTSTDLSITELGLQAGLLVYL